MPDVLSRIPPLTPQPPASLTSFVGRDREVEAISRLLSAARLVTLTGAGGSGKTRLAGEIDYYVALVRTAEPHFITPERPAWVDRVQRELDAAAATIGDALRALQQDPQPFWLARALELMNVAECARGAPLRGARLFGAAERRRERMGAVLFKLDRDRLENAGDWHLEVLDRMHRVRVDRLEALGAHLVAAEPHAAAPMCIAGWYRPTNGTRRRTACS